MGLACLKVLLDALLGYWVRRRCAFEKIKKGCLHGGFRWHGAFFAVALQKIKGLADEGQKLIQRVWDHQGVCANI